MQRFTNAERTDMILAYGAADGNSRRAARLYAARFPIRHLPDPRTFTRLHQQLRDTGTFDGNRRHVGGPHPQRAHADDEERILQHFETNPRTSTRAAAGALGIRSHSRVWQSLHDNGMHPYHFQRVQELTPADFNPRERFAHWFLNKYQEDNEFPKYVLFTDESTFTRSGIVNTHNFHMWQNENPHIVRQSNYQHRFSVNVWAGIISNNLVGPYVLPERVTGESYYVFLREVLPGLLDSVPLGIRRRMWFQHDGCPAHYAINVRQYLDRTYPNRWIGRSGPVPWPARSPDMTPLDFYLWGHMKSLIYETPVETEMDLVGRIVAAAGCIADDPGVFDRVQESILRRYQKCIDVQGRHFEQFL